MVFTMGSFSHVDMVWDDPQVALFLRRLASFSRLLRFDRRGTGASDPLPPNPLPAWETYAEELDAVMDAAGSRRAAVLANGRRPARPRRTRRAMPATGGSGAGRQGSSGPSPAQRASRANGSCSAEAVDALGQAQPADVDDGRVHLQLSLTSLFITAG
jgi:hypothetical protein